MILTIGLGFVGLTTALGFSHKGHKVYGYDINSARCDELNAGRVPFTEAHLDDILRKSLGTTFFLTDNLKESVQNSRYIFLCVGTPSQADGSTDLSYIFNAIRAILSHIPKGGKDYKVLVIKSTIPPSSTDGPVRSFIENICHFRVGTDVGLANNPEFLREGYAWEDFIKPDRVVIGQVDERSGRMLDDLYKSFNAPIFRVSASTGEFIKYLSNTLLSTLISFANEMSMTSQAIGGIAIKDAFKILHMDKRWFGKPASMTSYVFPGCGYGGYCLPKDISAMVSISEKSGHVPELLKAVIKTNGKIKNLMADHVIKNVDPEDYVGILGLAFKPNSDDVRDSPSKDIIQCLLAKGHKKILAYDPMAMNNFKQEFKFPIEYAQDLPSCLQKVKNVLILTGWKDFVENRALMAGKKIFDFRYIL